VEFELIQLADEGHNTNELKKEWESVKKNSAGSFEIRKHAVKFIEKLEALKSSINNNEIEKFISSLKQLNTGTLTHDGNIKDKITGGWAGRAAGCLLGKPIEKYNRSVIKEILQSNNSWPLKYYITSAGMPEELLKKYPWNKHDGRESLRENLVCMTEDDDMNYAMLNLKVLEQYGRNFTTENVAETWLGMLPVMSTFTAERAAYNNLLQFVDVPGTAIRSNPYREWIGAMIRADIWGWINPGDPVQAVEMAYKDASLSHTRDGIYASMFAAALISVSFYAGNPPEALWEALKYIPAESRTAEAVTLGIDTAQKYNFWDKVLDVLLEKYKNYFWVHAVNNTAIVSAALAFSKGSFADTVTNTVMAGLDTDSAGATAGSVIGTMKGINNLPREWIAPLNNRIRSSLKGFDNSALSGLAERTFNFVK
jgi:ADP-ribosylglycohydrolase